MISVIVCSIKKNLLEELSNNIKDTIGVEYELIEIDNNVEQVSISEAYNKGAEIAKYKYLVFCHEDLLFLNHDWGKEICKTFLDSSIGMIGSCGAVVKPKVGASWTSVPPKFHRSNMIQHNKIDERVHIVQRESEEKELSDVVVVDGLFMCISKEKWSNYKFDHHNFDGFHLYDQDYSMQIIRGSRIVINHNILVEHFSLGNRDKEWLKYSKRFIKKWRDVLPIKLNYITNEECREAEYSALRSYILNNLKYGESGSIFLSDMLRLFMLKPLKFETISILKRFFMFQRN